jgi:hypothetical protein
MVACWSSSVDGLLRRPQDVLVSLVRIRQPRGAEVFVRTVARRLRDDRGGVQRSRLDNRSFGAPYTKSPQCL